MLIDEPSSLTVGHLNNTAAIAKNVNALTITFHDLEETTTERGFNISANLHEVGRGLNHLINGPSSHATKDVMIAKLVNDPIALQAITAFGAWEWDRLNESNEVRATGLGTPKVEGQNSDLNELRGPTLRNHHPFLFWIGNLLAKQAFTLFARPSTDDHLMRKELIRRSVEVLQEYF